MYEEKENAHNSSMDFGFCPNKRVESLWSHMHAEKKNEGGVKADKLSREMNDLALAPSTADTAMTNCWDKFVQLQWWWVTLVKVAAITHLIPISRL